MKYPLLRYTIIYGSIPQRRRACNRRWWFGSSFSEDWDDDWKTVKRGDIYTRVWNESLAPNNNLKIPSFLVTRRYLNSRDIVQPADAQNYKTQTDRIATISRCFFSAIVCDFFFFFSQCDCVWLDSVKASHFSVLKIIESTTSNDT